MVNIGLPRVSSTEACGSMSRSTVQGLNSAAPHLKDRDRCEIERDQGTIVEYELTSSSGLVGRSHSTRSSDPGRWQNDQ